MLSSRPYLLRALHEWIVDCGLTPHILVDSAHRDLDVPDSARGSDGKTVLNVSPTAVRDLIIDQDLVTFVARFGGVSRAVSVPTEAVMAIYARENGHGMMFPDGDDAGEGDGGTGERQDSESSGRPRPGRPNLRVIK